MPLPDPDLRRTWLFGPGAEASAHETMLASGVLIFAGVGLMGPVLGGNYLDYFVLDRDPVLGQHRGIFWVEVGVAVTVSGVMLKIFYMFASRGKDPE